MLLKILLLNLFAASVFSIDSFQLDLCSSENFIEAKCKGFKSKEISKEINLDEVPTSYRLPNDSIPLGYSVTLITDIDQEIFTFNGRVEIHIRVINPTSVITLHYRQINITKVEQRKLDNLVFRRDLQFEKIPSHDFLKINLTETSKIGDEFLLEIQYDGILRDDGGGFYRAFYDVNGTRVWYATTQFQIADARHAMPCYDEPGIRAPIQLTVAHSPNYHAVSNTPILRIEKFGIYQRTIFEIIPSMPTYLLAFLISPFEYVSNNDVRVEQKVYAKPESIRNGEAEFALDILKPMLEKFENYLKMEFPLKKLDHAAITQFNFGAMENFGLVTYAENALLYNPNRNNGFQIKAIIAHELAHQWFGNIVSPQWWSVVWISEGFATFLHTYIPSLLFSEFNFEDIFASSLIPISFMFDASNTSWPLNKYVESYEDLWRKFDIIGYYKSACIIRMFREVLTPSTFAKGLNYYLTDNYMKAATPQELHSSFQKAYDEDFPGNSVDINLLMSTWEDQSGYPLISVEKHDGNLIFKQRRIESNVGEIYAVPLIFTTKTDSDYSVLIPKAWLNSKNLTIPMNSINFHENDWIVLNTQRVGYYRVDYSKELWKAIIKQLNENHEVFNPIDRFVLREEIYIAWKEYSRVTPFEILDSLQYFSLEDDYRVWNKANEFLMELQSRLIGQHVHRYFRKFIKDLTKHHIQRLGYESIEGELNEKTQLRNLVTKWSCIVWDEECLSYHREKWMQMWKKNVTEEEFNSVNLCFAMSHIDVDVFSEILDGITTNINYPHRDAYITHIGCNTNYTNLMSMLMATIDMENDLEVSERFYLMRSSMNGGFNGMTALFHFIDVNFLPVITISREEFVFTTLEMAKRVTSECQINTLALLRNHAFEYGFLTLDERRAVSNQMLVAINWNAKYLDMVEDWFEFSYTGPIVTTTVPPPAETTTPCTCKAAGSIIVSFNLLLLSIFLTSKFSGN